MSFETLSVDDGQQNQMIIKAHLEQMAQACSKLNIDKCKMINNYMFGIALNNHPTHSWVRLFKTSKLFSCIGIKYIMKHDKNSDKNIPA